MKRQVASEKTTDMCAACDIDLATCDTIWAAGGALYCSRECGIADYENEYEYGDEAEKYFDMEAEEINPKDIGIVPKDICTNCSEVLNVEDLYNTSRGQLCMSCITDIITEGIAITINGRIKV